MVHLSVDPLWMHFLLWTPDKSRILPSHIIKEDLTYSKSNIVYAIAIFTFERGQPSVGLFLSDRRYVVCAFFKKVCSMCLFLGRKYSFIIDMVQMAEQPNGSPGLCGIPLCIL